MGEKSTRRDRPRRPTLRRTTGWALLIAVLLGWWVFLRPSSLGGPVTFITVTGVSMEPGLRTDDLAVMYARDEYAVGDVVAFRSTPPPGTTEEGPYVIHRIVGGDPINGFVTRGDNNDWDDPWTPAGDDIAGEKLVVIPDAGVVMRWITQPFNLAAMMAAVAAGLVLAGGSSERGRGTGRVAADRATGSAAAQGDPLADLPAGEDLAEGVALR